MFYAMVVVASLVMFNYWDEVRKGEIWLPSLLLGLPSGILNVVALNYLYQQQISIMDCLFTGASLVIVLAVGLFLADKAGLPQLWAKANNRPKWLLLVAGVAGGLLLGFVNLKLTMYSIESTNTVPAFFEQIQALTRPMITSILLSVQAGITEEILFRMFLLPGAYLVFFKLLPNHKKVSLALAVISSAYLFGLIPTHNLAFGTIIGVFLGWAYLHLGLLPMMAMHMVSNLLYFVFMIGPGTL